MRTFMSSSLKVKQMILFRLLSLIIGLYIIYLLSFRLGVGMIPVWFSLFIISFSLSFNKVYSLFFGNRFIKFVFIVGLVCLVLVEIVIVYSGVKTSLKEDSDYIIVLGASVKGETPSLTLRHRIKKANDYLDLHPDTVAILSGGQGPGEQITEAEAMKRYLLDKGIKESRLVLEDKSTNTKENIKFSYDIINKRTKNKDQKVIVISSSFHLLRSQIIAKKQGFNVKAIGSSTLIYLVPNYYLREFFGIFYELIRK